MDWQCCMTNGETQVKMGTLMPRNYSTPRYRSKPRPGRKKLPAGKRRRLVSARVSPETYKFLKNHPDRLGLLIDEWVRLEQLGAWQHEGDSAETVGIGSELAEEGCKD